MFLPIVLNVLYKSKKIGREWPHQSGSCKRGLMIAALGRWWKLFLALSVTKLQDYWPNLAATRIKICPIA